MNVRKYLKGDLSKETAPSRRSCSVFHHDMMTSISSFVVKLTHKRDGCGDRILVPQDYKKVSCPKCHRALKKPDVGDVEETGVGHHLAEHQPETEDQDCSE